MSGTDRRTAVRYRTWTTIPLSWDQNRCFPGKFQGRKQAGPAQNPAPPPLTMLALQQLSELAKDCKSQPNLKPYALHSPANNFCHYERHIRLLVGGCGSVMWEIRFFRISEQFFCCYCASSEENNQWKSHRCAQNVQIWQKLHISDTKTNSRARCQ